MNKKITVKTPNGAVRYCVLDGNASFSEQLKRDVFSISNDYTVEYCKDKIEVLDVYHQETIAVFEVLSVEDCEMNVTHKWVHI